MTTTDLNGRWALILGASSGLGAATALELARYGVNIIGLYLGKGHTPDAIKAQVAELQQLGVQAHFIRTNIANAERRRKCIAQIKQITASQPIFMLMHSVAFGSLELFIPDEVSKAATQSQLEMTMDVMANSLVYWTQDLFYTGLFAKGSRVFGMSSAGSRMSAVAMAQTTTSAPAMPMLRSRPSGKTSSASMLPATVTPDTTMARPEVRNILSTATS